MTNIATLQAHPPRRTTLLVTGIPFSQREHDERVCAPASRQWVVTDILQHNPNHLNILNTLRHAEGCVRASLRGVPHELHFNIYPISKATNVVETGRQGHLLVNAYVFYVGLFVRHGTNA